MLQEVGLALFHEGSSGYPAYWIYFPHSAISRILGSIVMRMHAASAIRGEVRMMSNATRSRGWVSSGRRSACARHTAGGLRP